MTFQDRRRVRAAIDKAARARGSFRQLEQRERIIERELVLLFGRLDDSARQQVAR